MFTYYGWSLGIGDPTCLGWFTFCAYFLTALLCLAAYKSCQQPPNTENGNRCLSVSRWIWRGLFLAFLFLGMNKQLDLQSLLTAVGRHFALQQGWYAERREYQAIFIAALALFSVMMLLTFAYMFRLVGTAERVALMGGVIVHLFVLVRASSFQHMDIYIYGRQLAMKMNWVLELSGITTVFFAALFCQMQNNKR